MPEEFSEISSQSIRALVKHMVEIGDVLKKELPFDYLTPTCHVENGTDNHTVGFFAKWGETLHSLMIYTHYLDAPPEPKEMYTPNCCGIGTLEISSSEPLPREAFEVCGTPERWMVHHNDKWVPLSASYVAFLTGINQKRPSESCCVRFTQLVKTGRRCSPINAVEFGNYRLFLLGQSRR